MFEERQQPMIVSFTCMGGVRLLARLVQWIIVCGVLAINAWFFKLFWLGFVVDVLWIREERVVLAAFHGVVSLGILANLLYGYGNAVMARPANAAVDVEKDAPSEIRHCSACQIDTPGDCEHCPVSRSKGNTSDSR
jgi:hypothetical protein